MNDSYVEQVFPYKNKSTTGRWHPPDGLRSALTKTVNNYGTSRVR